VDDIFHIEMGLVGLTQIQLPCHSDPTNHAKSVMIQPGISVRTTATVGLAPPEPEHTTQHTAAGGSCGVAA
jgi:hypothetical protein